MEMELDPAAAHYRQRLQEAEDNSAILTVRLHAAYEQINDLVEKLKAKEENENDPQLPIED